MNALKYTSALLLLVVLAACSRQQVYQEVQRHQQFECEKLPPSQRDDCLERTDLSYEEYQRQREVLLGEDER